MNLFSIQQVSDLTFTELAENEVLVKIAYSDVNYKDALAMSESGQVIRTYPMTPGIDLSGTVVQSKIHVFQRRSCTCYWFWAWRHPSRRLQPISKSTRRLVSSSTKKYDTASSDDFGTAGFTAMLCVNALIRQGMTSDKKLSLLVLLAV